MDLPDLPQTEAAIIEMTNAFRAEHKLAPLQPNSALANAAQDFANYLARTSRFAHEADGRKPGERARAAGYRYCIVAENLALNQRSSGFATRELASEAIGGWKNSPPHREAMLAPQVTEIGVGIARGPERDPKFLSVQLFGRPESYKYKFEIENLANVTIDYALSGQRHSIPASVSITHTICTPSIITFDLATVTSTFETHDGARFRIKRGPTGQPVVDVERSASALGAPVSMDTRRANRRPLSTDALKPKQ